MLLLQILLIRGLDYNMFRVKYFDNEAGLERLLNTYCEDRHDIVDIIFSCTYMDKHGYLIYETDEVFNPDYYQKNI